MVVIQLITYAAILVFFAAVLVRFVKLKRLPIHLRWELYPVAHEKGKAHYGGSFLEEPDWWTKPRHSSLMGELKVMIPEILLLKGVWEHNRSQWLRSFPFHFGLYLLSGFLMPLFVGGIAVAAGADISAEAGGINACLAAVTSLVGWVGMGLALIGSLALLGRRLLNVDYREYTKRGDYFNLLFFVITLVVALLAHLVSDPTSAGLRGFFARLITFDLSAPVGSVPILSALEVALAAILVAYIPLTHMSHFFTKWFMYHDIRWNDEPNMRGGDIERRLETPMSYPVSWAAPHIRGDGKKTWVDVATSGVEED